MKRNLLPAFTRAVTEHCHIAGCGREAPCSACERAIRDIASSVASRLDEAIDRDNPLAAVRNVRALIDELLVVIPQRCAKCQHVRHLGSCIHCSCMYLPNASEVR
jgi:hypothetical protein